MARSKIKGTKGKPVKKAKNRSSLKVAYDLPRQTSYRGDAKGAQRAADAQEKYDKYSKKNKEIDKKNSKRWFFQRKQDKYNLSPYTND